MGLYLFGARTLALTLDTVQAPLTGGSVERGKGVAKPTLSPDRRGLPSLRSASLRRRRSDCTANL